MTAKLTHTERRMIVAYAWAKDYDRATVRVSRDGEVTAKLDPDQRPDCHGVRLLVGNAADIIAHMTALYADRTA